MANQTQVREIRIVTDTGSSVALKDLAKQFGLFNREVKKASSTLEDFKRMFIGYIGAISVREIASMSDSMQQLKDRINLLKRPGENAQAILEQLNDSANRTKTSTEALATVYTRVANSTKSLNLSTETMIQLTETLQNSFRLSGATITESTAAAIQLSQGFASGQLRGQELRSVLEANVEIGDILSKTFNVTRGELYKLAEAGQLTANKVLVALLQNTDSVNKKASQLSATFEQSLTVAMNNFRLAVGNLNTELGISSKFAKGLQWITDNTAALGVLIMGLALTQIPKLIAAIANLGKAFLALSSSNLIIATLTSIAVLLTVVYTDSEKARRGMDQLASNMLSAFVFVTYPLEKIVTWMEKLQDMAGQGKPLTDLIKGMRDGARNLSKDLDFRANAIDLSAARKDQEKREAERKKVEADILRLQKMLQGNGKEPKIKEVLAGINRELSKGLITLGQYQEKIFQFNITKVLREFRDGKVAFDQVLKVYTDLGRMKIGQLFNQGTLSLQQFNAAMDDLKLNELNYQFQTGAVTLRQYDQEIMKLSTRFNKESIIRTGAQDYLESIGSLASNISDVMRNTFSNFENSLVESLTKGKFSFKDFANSLMEDLARVAIRMAIMKPLVEGIFGSYMPSGSTTTTTAAPTTGGYNLGFDKKFAKGGVVNSATAFSYGKGKTGLMGESGPEGVLPLARTSNGDLGVQTSGMSPVQINIINNSDTTISQQESTDANGMKRIDVYIENKVKEGIARGTYDSTFKASYNLRRAGN